MLKDWPHIERYRGPLLERAKAGYLALYEAINELGRNRFSKEWTGDEITMPVIEPISDIASYRKAIKKYRNPDDPRCLVRTADGWKDAASWDEAVALYDAAAPALKAFFDAAYATRQRFEMVSHEISDAMALGKLTAYVWDRKNTGRVFDISSDYWGTEKSEATLDLTHPTNLESRGRPPIDPARWRAPNQAFARATSYAGVIDTAVVYAEKFRAWLSPRQRKETEAAPIAAINPPAHAPPVSGSRRAPIAEKPAPSDGAAKKKRKRIAPFDEEDAVVIEELRHIIEQPGGPSLNAALEARKETLPGHGEPRNRMSRIRKKYVAKYGPQDS